MLPRGVYYYFRTQLNLNNNGARTSYDSKTEFHSCSEFVNDTHSVVQDQGQGEMNDSKMNLEHCSITTSKEEETSFVNDPNRESEITQENSSNIFEDSKLSCTTSTNNKADSRYEFVDPLTDPNME